MSKQSRAVRERRQQQNDTAARMQAAWQASVPAARAKEFDDAVASARARGPLKPPPDQPKGTVPNPPRPGREPKVKKDPARSKSRF